MPYAALTFDDGPGPATAEVLEALEARSAPATFFVVGSCVTAHRELLRRAAAAGHEIGNHTYDHPRLEPLRRSAVIDQFVRTNDAVEAATGRRPRFGRAPYERPSAHVRDAAGAAGVELVGWQVDSEDHRLADPADIARRVLADTLPWSVVLLHDAGGSTRQPTVQALPAILDGLAAEGFELLPLAELLNRRTAWIEAARIRA